MILRNRDDSIHILQFMFLMAFKFLLFGFFTRKFERPLVNAEDETKEALRMLISSALEMLICCSSRSLMFTCIFFNKPIVENEFIGDIFRSLDTMNFVFFFINPVSHLDELPEITFGLLGDIFTISPLIMRRSIDH